MLNVVSIRPICFLVRPSRNQTERFRKIVRFFTKLGIKRIYAADIGVSVDIVEIIGLDRPQG